VDVEQVKKFNSMIKTLTKQGYIDNNDDAYAIAAKIYEKGKPPEMPKSKLKENSKINESEINQLIEKKVQQRLFAVNQKFQDALYAVSKELQELITNNKNELEALKKQIKQPVENKEVQKKIDKDVCDPPNPRQGCYTSEDVALDKIFYYGQK